MECSIKFLENPKEFYEPGETVKAEVTLIVPKKESVKSEAQTENFRRIFRYDKILLQKSNGQLRDMPSVSGWKRSELRPVWPVKL